MGAWMSTNAVEIAACAEACQESLADRMARGPLPLKEALRYAIDIAGVLRDLHRHGLAYGAVSSHLILLGASRAALRKTDGHTHLGDPQADVTDFGELLGELFRREDSADSGLYDLREEARTLALRCRDEGPAMQQVLIGLRLLGLRARHAAAAGVRAPRPILVPRLPAVAAPAPVCRLRVRVRIRMSLHWKPLVNLAIFALSGK